MKEACKTAPFQAFLTHAAPLWWLEDGDVMGVVGSGQQESSGDTHNAVNQCYRDFSSTMSSLALAACLTYKRQHNGGRNRKASFVAVWTC
jgi:hypothetical protein